MVNRIPVLCCSPSRVADYEIPGAERGFDFTAGAGVPKGVPAPSGTAPAGGVIFSVEELKQLQYTLAQMEAAKDDPFKQLALAAQLRLLQEKQKEASAVAKSANTQAEALKKLQGVMSEEEMNELKKALTKYQQKAASRSRGEDARRRDERVSRDKSRDKDREKERRKGDRPPPWRSSKKKTPWDDEDEPTKAIEVRFSVIIVDMSWV